MQELIRSRQAVLIAVIFSSFISPFAISSVNVAMPLIAEEFGMSAVLLGRFGMAFLVAAAALMLPFGKLADMRGTKGVFTLGMGVFAAGALLSAAAPSVSWLITMRAAQGLGGAMMFSTGMAILAHTFPRNELGKYIGINTAAVYIGLSAGPLAGGLFCAHLGWRSVFIATGILGFAGALLAGLKLEKTVPRQAETKFDFAGSVIYAVSICSFIHGFSFLSSFAGAAYAVLGIAGIAVFCISELKAQNPVMDMRLFAGNAVFAFSNLAALINYSATFAVTFLMSLYLQYVKGMPVQEAGIILMAQPLMMAAVSPFAGRLSDRIQPRVIASWGMAVTVAGLAGLAFIDGQTGIIGIIMLLIILGAGFGLFASPNTNAVMASVEKRNYSIASAALSSMRVLGQTFSIAAATMVFSVYMGDLRIGAENITLFMKGFKAALVLFSAVCFLGIFASLARGNIGNAGNKMKNTETRRLRDTEREVWD